MLVYLNGDYVEEAEARVSVFDRGFLYGDTVYETIRTHRGEILFWSEHERRLRRSCELAAFEIEWGEVHLPAIVGELLRRNGLTEARVRITLSRGTGDPDQITGFHPIWIVTLRPFRSLPDDSYEAGVSAVLVSVTRNAACALSPEIKSGNFLNNLLARREARLRGAAEGIMTNPAGMLCEGAMSNIFWLRRGVLETPALDQGLLPGVTRGKILALARASLGQPDREALTPPGLDRPGLDHPISGLHDVREVAAPPAALDMAEEIFLTSTSLEALSVTRWEDRPVGGGGGGAVANALRKRLRSLYPQERSA
jgi:branched-chain amino acid aminotransferase